VLAGGFRFQKPTNAKPETVSKPIKDLMSNSVIGIGIALGVSFFFLYTRGKKWTNPNLRWLMCGGLFISGLLGLVFMSDTSKANIMLYWGLCVPILSYGMDRLFRYLSFKIYDRDFVLWLCGSDEIDDSIGGRNPHVKPLDIVFSLGLLIFIVLTTLIGGLLLQKQ
jgi:hypothetical protein